MFDVIDSYVHNKLFIQLIKYKKLGDFYLIYNIQSIVSRKTGQHNKVK